MRLCFWSGLAVKAGRPGKICLLPGRGGGPLARVLCCLATYFSPPTVRAPADARTTNDSNITAAVAPVTGYLLFMVIALKGFVNISSLPSLVKTDILTRFCGTPASLMNGHCISVHVRHSLISGFLKWLLVLHIAVFQPQTVTSKVLYSEVQNFNVKESSLPASDCGSCI